MTKARKNPKWFLTDFLGTKPWEKQLEIVESLRWNEKTLVPSCVSSGKSFIGGGIVIWWLASRYPARVFIVAPTERQIKINLWGELSKIYHASQYPLGGDLQTLDWKIAPRIAPNWFAKGFSPKDALGVFGIHGENDLVIFDDAQGITPPIYDAFENASAGGTAKFLYLCNPAVVAGPIYEALTSKRSDFNVIRIDAYSTPNVKAGRVVVPGLIIKEKVEEWIKKFGWDSDFVRVKVRALPPKQEPDTLIPIDWLEQATSREVVANGPVVLGVDVARFGDDESVIYARNGRQGYAFREGWIMNGNDTMEVTGRVVQAIKDTGAEDVFVDEIGIGAGVVDRLREIMRDPKEKLYLRSNCTGINVAQKAHNEEEFANLRSELWWAARESLDPKNKIAMALETDNDLIADLSCVKYKVRSDGRIEVEPKEATKKRLGRSPDKGDAYCLAVFRSYLTRSIPTAQEIRDPYIGARTPSWL